MFGRVSKSNRFLQVPKEKEEDDEAPIEVQETSHILNKETEEDIDKNMSSYYMRKKLFSNKKQWVKLPDPNHTHIKAPSKLLVPENVINKVDAVHSGAKYGSGSFVFYKMKRGVQEMIGLLPPSKGGMLASLVDETRNESRVIFSNLKRLEVEFVLNARNYLQTPDERRERALTIVFFIELNWGKLTPLLDNLQFYYGLLKGGATISIERNTIVHSKDYWDEKHPLLLAREIQYENEMKFLRELANNHSYLETAIQQLETQIDVNLEYYDRWKHQNFKRILIMINTYRGLGCILGQGIQGAITSAINAGIAAGTGSIPAAAAAVVYLLSTLLRIIESMFRTHFENDLIRNAQSALDAVTQLKESSSNDIKSVHKLMRALVYVELIHNQIEGLCNTAFNIAGTVSGLPLSTGRPQTTTHKISSLSDPLFFSSPSEKIQLRTTQMIMKR